MNRSRVFIGSSTEGLHLAEAVQARLTHKAEVTLWNQGVFEAGSSYLGSLIQATTAFDFGVLVLTKDDVIHSRGAEKGAPRDNVMFELGLFVGALGRRRTFFLHNRESPPKIASDLAGIAGVTYSERDDGNLQAAVNPACLEIAHRIAELGPRSDHDHIEVVKDPRVLCVGTEKFVPMDVQQDRAVLEKCFGDVEFEPDATGRWLRDKLLNQEFDLIHLCTTVDPKSGELVLGSDDRISAASFGKLVQVCGAKVVVLASCDSVRLAEHVARTTNMVAATTVAAVSTFIEWEEVFYTQLGKGLTLSESHDLAKETTGAPIVLLPRTDVVFDVGGRGADDSAGA